MVAIGGVALLVLGREIFNQFSQAEVKEESPGTSRGYVNVLTLFGGRNDENSTPAAVAENRYEEIGLRKLVKKRKITTREGKRLFSTYILCYR